MLEPPVHQSHQFADSGLAPTNDISSESITTEMLDQLIRQVTPPTPQSHISTSPSQEPGLTLFMSSGFPTQVTPIVPTTQTH
ncbi:hypothetical protein K7432_011119 [Basidiobolus ranarum]|uniref:Uncharacterized protein n=1 Tax=Basidiobolus ranarum TaxID=34480 RepID=A0ABR2WMR7_9FUNG